MLNLDELSGSTFALILFFVVSVCGAVSFPLMDGLKRHADFLRTFKAQNRRLR